MSKVRFDAPTSPKGTAKAAEPASKIHKDTKAPSKADFFFDDSTKRSVSKDYDITEKLGIGGFGVVKKGKHKKSRAEVAIKCCKKSAVDPHELKQEVKILRMMLGQPAIVQLHGVYESKNRVNLIMELITGGELFDKIVELEFYSEADAANLILQIATAVEYCHAKNIVHRDLKPENLLFEDEKSNKLKLIDFGVAEVLDGNKPLTGVVGSRTYMAPEVVKNTGYGKPVDMYSIGVIMYILLCGYPPFDHEVGILELDFPSPDWDEISDTAKDLIRNLLQDDASKRMTATQLKTHNWTTGNNVSHQKLGRTIKSMNNFNTYRKVATSAMPNRNKRVSVFGMFGLNKEKQKVQSARGVDPNVDQGENLKTEIEKHRENFKTLAQESINYAHKLSDAEKRKALLKTAEEMGLLANAYGELADEFIAKLK